MHVVMWALTVPLFGWLARLIGKRASWLCGPCSSNPGFAAGDIG
jgi:hypothetical protein